MNILHSSDDLYPNWPGIQVPLYYRGAVEAFDHPYLAVVGTRKPHADAVRSTRALVLHAVTLGWGIVSGLAPGIDTVAHLAALEGGGKTIAIVGSGLDQIKHNLDLHAAILDAGGLIVSEKEPHVEQRAQHLVARNRLQVACASHVVVGQTGYTGGTTHTIRFALTALHKPSLYVAQTVDQATRDLTMLGGKELADKFSWQDRRTREALSDLPPASLATKANFPLAE